MIIKIIPARAVVMVDVTNRAIAGSNEPFASVKGLQTSRRARFVTADQRRAVN